MLEVCGEQEHPTSPEVGRSELIRDAAWETAFLIQLTDAVAVSVGGFAKKRASWLERKTKRKDDQLWREFLQDALTDTWLGNVTWDPAKVPLDLHLKSVIRSRTAKLMKHLSKFPRVSAHAPPLELEREMSVVMEMERASEQAIDLRTYVDGVVGALLSLAAHDEQVVAIVNCFARGLVDRRDVLRHTGMTPAEYHNARRRLLALVSKLPQTLRDEAIRALA